MLLKGVPIFTLGRKSMVKFDPWCDCLGQGSEVHPKCQDKMFTKITSGNNNNDVENNILLQRFLEDALCNG